MSGFFGWCFRAEKSTKWTCTQSIKHWTHLYACRKAHTLIVWLSTLVVIGHWAVSRHGMFVHQWEQNGPPPPLFSQVTIAMEPWGGSLDLNSVGVEQTKAGKTQGARGGSRGNVCAGDFERLHVGLEGKKEKRVKVNHREGERKKHVFI